MSKLLYGFVLAMLVTFISCKPDKKSPAIGGGTGITTPPTVFVLPAPATCGYNFTAADTAGWVKIFEDNFDTPSLPDWEVWKGGAFNNELQLYKNENITVKDGYLFIHSKKETATGLVTPFVTNTKTFGFTSGRITTKKLFGPTVNKPVRMIARIQVPQGEGLWPAFWSFGDPWPTKGEIDILEYRGSDTTKFEANYHYGNNPSTLLTNPLAHVFKYQLPTGKPALNRCFYVYEAEWANGQINIKLDGQLLKSYKEPEQPYLNAFANVQHNIILNLAVGGAFFTNLEQSKIPDNGVLIADWVRVYTK
jgi:beta-glucanase (GH16 family)